MDLGKLGEVVFEIKQNYSLLYNNLSRKTSADYAEQKAHNTYPRLEFANPNLREISMSIKLVDSLLEKDPLKSSETINNYILRGEVVELTIGPYYRDSMKVVVLDSQETFKVMKGNKVSILELQINLKEYK